ncbi:urease accessory protein UreE [Rubellimicrobium arenae]|uniref:urease accessory protein UreE n=1 Tax=Rubellimicrobium arenae TaxID=2817372 RepID=UPI001B3033DB|nr:urease accessory protein UreE [Rubellimicrobium arenae]
MTDLPPARGLRRSPLPVAPHGSVTLAHDDRLLRRRRLVTASGEGFLVDLPQTTGVEDGDAFELADGRLIAVVAAAERLLEVRGDLPRLAWHIGNRHAPCELLGDRVRVLADPVMARMLKGLGAEVAEVVAPFRPEGGAYGEGRVMGHSHGHAPEHDHRLGIGSLGHHEPSHGHGHDH